MQLLNAIFNFPGDACKMNKCESLIFFVLTSDELKSQSHSSSQGIGQGSHFMTSQRGGETFAFILAC